MQYVKYKQISRKEALLRSSFIDSRIYPVNINIFHNLRLSAKTHITNFANSVFGGFFPGKRS